MPSTKRILVVDVFKVKHLSGSRLAVSQQKTAESTYLLYLIDTDLRHEHNSCLNGVLLFDRERWKYDSICFESLKYSCKQLMEEVKSQDPGLTGLVNLGNTCYMNAVLQCLCSMPPLVEYFLSGKHKVALQEDTNDSAAAFSWLISSMWLGDCDCVSLDSFHSVLEKRYPTFTKQTQQDAQEFLICVLNELHEALKNSSRIKHVPDAQRSRGRASETSIITELFEGQLSYAITCLECRTTIRRPESFTVLSLPIPSKSSCSLQDCLECFFQQDTLTSNNQIHCSLCGTKRDAVVETTITKAPQIIIFHLKRFEWQGKRRRKLATDIHYPLSNLDLSPYRAPHCCVDAEYSLYAVVVSFSSLFICNSLPYTADEEEGLNFLHIICSSVVIM
ncbi:inactive ubiquitin carboxyl-terminal hydrolase 50 [Indicator indicator]|uniref:inactive ubiquitin carboxyl-terminal hydrolase 50 n=1 Tax=Indicator indicator TaxID=1002788 RepID=UPI0023E02526|nr:inactive ubiquitin carboxyl-terminal hydrolase 50 [Indicator indicator]